MTDEIAQGPTTSGPTPSGPTPSGPTTTAQTTAAPDEVARWRVGARPLVEVPCTLDLEQTGDSLHAYVDLIGCDVGPGDEVFVHDAPDTIPFGERATLTRRATVRRAGPLQRAIAHIQGYLELTELYDVSFTDGSA